MCNAVLPFLSQLSPGPRCNVLTDCIFTCLWDNKAIIIIIIVGCGGIHNRLKWTQLLSFKVFHWKLRQTLRAYIAFLNVKTRDWMDTTWLGMNTFPACALSFVLCTIWKLKRFSTVLHFAVSKVSSLCFNSFQPTITRGRQL